MKISGFTIVRNAEKYYFPIKESILSILPFVDEFVVALGVGDPTDRTREIIESINSNKIKIFDREWDAEKFKSGLVLREETNFALDQCTGDWCYYLQADEVAHEKDEEEILHVCQKYLNDPSIHGFLFNYHHFWGDYDHVLNSHAWYRQEIRLVRNKMGIRSHKDAQSFRLANNNKLNVKKLQAHIHHYGWVRPPGIMQAKKKEQFALWWGKSKAQNTFEKRSTTFDYGALGRLPRFEDSHPKVLDTWRTEMSWTDQLNQGNTHTLDRELFKHERLKYRALSYVENTFFESKTLFGYSNWNLV